MQNQLKITYLQNPQVETVNQQTTVGDGIKRTYGYNTPLTRPQLEKWREEFWETRTSGSKQVWELLHSCCNEDQGTAKALIEAAELQLPQNCLTTVID
jgi:hypothetical protein